MLNGAVVGPPFVVPDHVLEAWRKLGRRGIAEREAWERRYAALDEAKKAEFKRTSLGKLAPGSAG